MQTDTLQFLTDYLDGLDGPADLDTLESILTRMTIDRERLGECVIFNGERYQRNIVGRTDWYELVCICWQAGQFTPIHDHRGSSCAFRIIEGVATERQYEKDASGQVVPAGSIRMREGFVCAAADADIHAVHNLEDRELITLHIYSPALDRYNIYDLDSQIITEFEELTSVPMSVTKDADKYDWVI